MHKIKEITLTMPLPGLFIICLLSLPAGAQYGGGTGQPSDPYLIYTAEQMNAIGANRKDWDKHFKLMADIDLSLYAGRDFKIIGTGNKNAFTGVFDGNNKKISSFIYASTNGGYKGLFGYVKDSDAEIKNLGLIEPDIDIEAGSGVGSLVGWVDAGIITNCYAEGGSVSGKKWVGGLVGYNEGGEIKGCYATCVVSGNEKVGGLAGYNDETITNCYATGSVSGDRDVGGLVGDNGGTITISSAAGSVSGDDSVGGLVGDNGGKITNSSATGSVSGTGRSVGGLVGDNGGTIINCSARGNVLGSRDVGGLVGYNSQGTITNTHSSGSVSADTDVGGLVGDNTGKIRNCYATDSITGNDCVGGLVGINTWPGKINNCYSVGSVIGTTDVGGFVGFNDEAMIKTSFWDIRTSGQNNMCGRQMYGTGCNNANGKTTAGMQTKSTFLDAGWDFVAEIVNGTEDFWSICEGLDYPKLASQFLIGDFDGDIRVDLADFAVFAERWLSDDSNFLWCRGADLTNNGKVDFDDLKKFAENWLADDIGSPVAIGYVTIDDFESYNDLDPSDPESNRIFDTWLDGYDNPATNGSVIGYDNPPFAERSIVHGGMQSMPYFYNNFFKFSKAELSLRPPQDWTEEGAGVLSLWFRGDKANAPAPMNVVLNGSSPVYHDNPNATRIDTWTGWTIDLHAFASQGVNLTNVNTISIGFGDRNNIKAGGSGLVFFDDIRLYRPG